MKKTMVLYGSTIGNTEAAAETIAQSLGVTDKKNADSTSAEEIASCDVIIAGTSTWGDGELQDDWAALVDEVAALNLQGKKVALFGTGDQNGYPDTFVDGIGILYDAFVSAGATVVGMWPTEGYEHSSSRAVRNGTFVGLALDDDNQPGMTEERVRAWVALVKPELE